jgi:uncharacterized protein DUF6297
MVLLGVFIYGGIVVQAVRRMIASPPAGPDLPDLPASQWLLVGFAVLGVGLLMKAMLSVGPVVTSSSFQFWLISTPLDRKELLSRRFWWTVITGTVAGALLGLSEATLLRGGLAGKLTSTVAGATLVATAIAVSILLQNKVNDGRRLTTALTAGGVLIVVAAVVTTLPVIDLPIEIVAFGAIPLFAIARAYTGLGGLNRASLATGTEILSAGQVAAAWLDISLFAGILSIRKWRRIGRVRSRVLQGTRYWAMLSAEVRRLARNRALFFLWAGLLLAPYAAARVLPSLFVPTVQLFACVFAISPFATGLRNVCRSQALRRSLGGTDMGLRLTHLVVPTVIALVWTALTLPAAGTAATWLAPVAAVGFVYRRATQPVIDYAGTAVDSPFGLVPTNMFRQLLRGPLLLIVLTGIQLNL